MSPQTLAKQIKNHPELSFLEYATLFQNIVGGSAYRDGPYKVVIIKEFCRWYKIVLKATQRRDQVFLVSLFRMDQKTLRKTRSLPGL